MSATEENTSTTTLNTTLETLEAIELAGDLLREAKAHLLLRGYSKVDSEGYTRLTHELETSLVLARVSIGAPLSVEEDRDDN
jgi:hypothetical protein